MSFLKSMLDSSLNLNQNISSQQSSNINATTASTSQQQPMTMGEKLINLRQQWTDEVETLNNDMKNLPTLDRLLNVVYTKRQQAVDTYYATVGVMNKQIRAYKQQYATIYNNLKQGSNGIRYSNESSIQTQCEAALTDMKEIIDELKTFTDFMWETVRTIDGLQYAISSKIKIYELMNGLKF